MIVVLKKVLTPIVSKVSPDGMDVICVVLGVVIFDKETGPMEAVVMRLATLFRACPGKVDVRSAFLLDLIQSRIRDVTGHPVYVFEDQIHETPLLFFFHSRGSHSSRIIQMGAFFGPGQDIRRSFRGNQDPTALRFIERDEKLAGQILFGTDEQVEYIDLLGQAPALASQLRATKVSEDVIEGVMYKSAMEMFEKVKPLPAAKR